MLLYLLVIVGAVFIGWNIGANDAANCVGADVGSGKMSMRTAIFITSFFSLLGALLLGHHVIKTVGKGIVPLDTLDPHIAILCAIAGVFGAGFWVLLATYLKLPVSTSHSIVGAVGGAGLAIGAPIIWKKIIDIVICWVLTPFGAAFMSFIFFYLFSLMFKFVPKKHEDRVIYILLVITSAYMAFVWGANDVANATGLILGAKLMSPFSATLLGAAAIVVGIVTLGHRVIETVGFKITHLLPIMTLAAEVAAAVNVQIYTQLGIPVSTSHSIVGAVIGVGLTRGHYAIEAKMVRDIFFAWSATPLIAGILSFILMRVLIVIF